MSKEYALKRESNGKADYIPLAMGDPERSKDLADMYKGSWDINTIGTDPHYSIVVREVGEWEEYE